jgi:hypothetical protein
MIIVLISSSLLHGFGLQVNNDTATDVKFFPDYEKTIISINGLMVLMSLWQ